MIEKRKKSKELAFTLIEIIAVIIIIGIIALIAVPSVSKYINDSRNTAYISYEHTMEDAAKNRVIKCINGEEPKCDIPRENESEMVYLNELVDKGYVELMKNPQEPGFCDSELSYVEIANTGNDYEYTACLYCGQYKTDKALCTTYTLDADDPICGEVTGQSTNGRWVNTNRTISVKCSDATTGCTRTSFTKTFTQTTKESSISIVDKSGRKVQCPVKVYVDKTLPTCELKVTGTYDNDLGWYTGEVQVDLVSWDDADSEVLTYGIGTSLANRTYNKETRVIVKSGITTVMGYVKDKAGNEGICSKTIRTGVEKPKFDFRYKYQIFPNGETYEISGINQNGNVLVTATTNPLLTIKKLSKYTNVDRVIITLNSAAEKNAIAELSYSGTLGNVSGVATGVVTAGSKEIVFDIPQGNYSSMTIKFGTEANARFDIAKIELLTPDGGIFTNKDVGIKIDSIDTGVRTVGYSIDNGATEFKTTDSFVLPANTSGYIRTKNAGGIVSDPVEYNITGIDKREPAISIKVYKKGTNVEVSTGNWSDTQLEFMVTNSNVGISGADAYYCIDNNNTCTPDTKIEAGKRLNFIDSKVGVFYLRYMVVNGAGTVSPISSFSAKVDVTTPTCSIAANKTTWTNTDVTLTVTGVSPGASSIASYSWDNGATYNSTTTKVVGANGTYTAKVKNQAGTVGTCTYNVTNIDKSTPTVSIRANKKGTSTQVNSGSWSDKDLDFILTSANVGISGATITYCIDNNNSCTPAVQTSSGTNNTAVNNRQGIFYIRYRISNPAGTVSSIQSYTAKVDTGVPTCTIASSNTNWTSSDIKLTITGSNAGAASVESYSWDGGTTFNGTTTKTVGTNGTYTAKVKNSAGTVGTCTFNVNNIDKTTPTCSISSSNTGWTNQNITLTITGYNTGVSGIASYSWDGGSTFNTTRTKTVGSSTTYTAKVKNGAGTIGTCTFNVTNIDKTAPTCTVSKSNTGTTTGVTTTVTCNDTGGSTCDTSRSQTGETGKKNGTYTYTVYDKAGNSGTCSVTVVAQTQQRTKSCSSGNRCTGAGCETYKSCTHSECGVNQYKSCAHSECGVASYKRCSAAGCETYKSCTHSECGVNQYKSCATSGCGVASYKSCANSACGVNLYNRCSSAGCETYYSCANSACGVASYNSCATSGCGVNLYKRCSSAGCATYKSCSNSACGVASYKSCYTSGCGSTTSTKSGTNPSCPMGQGCSMGGAASLGSGMYRWSCTCHKYCANSACGVSSYKTCRTSGCGCETYNRGSACGVESYKTCANSACGVASYNTCRTSGCGCQTYNRGSACGVESYKTCRTSGCGVESYNTCRNSACGCQTYNRGSACGVESYKTCRTAGCGVESYNTCRNAACGVESYNTCRTSGCGCETYKRGSSCGVESYNTCRTSGCGVESYKTCRTSGCGCETYKQNISTCGCASWGSFGSWTNVNSCSAGESSNHSTTTECRVVYN